MSPVTVPQKMDSTTGNSSTKDGNEQNALTNAEVLRTILPAAAGSFMEFYEFAIFSYMSRDITSNFFADGHGGSTGTWAGFAITFLFRPLGGLVFGWVGDRYGRKPAMTATIVIMLITTLLQGLLPSFYCCGEAWGWVGLVTLQLLRAFQGLSAGGELSTAAVYIVEVSPVQKLGVNLAWISVTGSFGAWVVAAAVVFAFETVLSEEDMRMWGWRLPYLTSGIPGILIVLGRRFLSETPDFQQSQQAKAEAEKSSKAEQGGVDGGVVGEFAMLRELFANHKLALVVGGLGTSAFGSVSFVPPLYGVQFLEEFDGLAGNVVTLSELISYLLPALFACAAGMLVDKLGAGRVYTIAVLVGGVLLPAPLLYWWAHTHQQHAVWAAFVGQSILGLSLALMTSCYLWVVELFPVQVRVTGVSVAYNIGVGIFGGMGPLISDVGNRIIDPRGPVSAPAIYTLFTGVLALSACLGSRVLASRGVMCVTHIRPTPY